LRSSNHGGVNDSREPTRKGVLILLELSTTALDAVPWPRQQRVVFSIDLTTSDGCFSWRCKFNIISGDLLSLHRTPGFKAFGVRDTG